jgi:hypothetical protein
MRRQCSIFCLAVRSLTAIGGLKSAGGWWAALAQVSAALILIAVAGAGIVLCRPAPGPVVVAAYATDLQDRTPHQRYNARRAAAAIDGSVIPPGGVFSFNSTVKGWSADRGFLKAPVSYDGILVDDYGGGVCQTSTTLYNAALLAGLPILERHAHTFSPGYAPPGRDAAVAYSNIDLRFRNPYPEPLCIRAGVDAGRLVCKLECAHPPALRVTVQARVLDRMTPPPAPVQPGEGAMRSRWRLRGKDGLRVMVLRDIQPAHGPVRRELISDNTYLPVARAEWVAPRT